MRENACKRHGDVGNTVDEKLNKYLQAPEHHYFDFYTCDGQALFMEGVMP